MAKARGRASSVAAFQVCLLLACVACALLCFLTHLQFAQERIQQNRTWKGTSVAMATLDRLPGIGLAVGDVTSWSCWTTRIKGVPVCISLSPQMSDRSILVTLLRCCSPILLHYEKHRGVGDASPRRLSASLSFLAQRLRLFGLAGSRVIQVRWAQEAPSALGCSSSSGRQIDHAGKRIGGLFKSAFPNLVPSRWNQSSKNSPSAEQVGLNDLLEPLQLMLVSKESGCSNLKPLWESL